MLAARATFALLLTTGCLLAAPLRAEPATPKPPPCRVLQREPPAPLYGPRSPAYRPLFRYELSEPCMALELPVSLLGTFERAGAVTLDRYGTRGDSFGLAPQARIGARFDSGRRLQYVNLHAVYEHDVVTGFVSTEPGFAGQGFPQQNGVTHEPRQLYARAAFDRYAQLSLGLMTSHWGLGLLSNDGAQGWHPGSARFADPRSGDRVLRAVLSTGPHSAHGVFAAVGGDVLYDDDVMLEGDSGNEIIAAVMVGRGRPHSGGVYLVRRHQEAADGSATNVWVVDLTGSGSWRQGNVMFGAAFEAALVTGTTELAPSTDFPSHDVLQLGVAVRGWVGQGWLGAVVDVLYASGDGNLDDAAQNGFKADPNYEMGLLLFRHVLAAQTARAVATAGDPNLVGVPSEDLERFATRGSATNTLAVFPRVGVRPLDGMEIYGGPLFALAVEPLVDPLNTRVAGGTPRNALDQPPGPVLGTELDLGFRYRVHFDAGPEIEAGLEGGMLFPGSALQGRAVTTDQVLGLRAMLGGRF